MKLSTLLIAASVTASAQTLPTTIRVSSETVPPGGMAQMKVLLTSPKPITTGNMSMDLSGVFFDSIDGIALFDPTGDVVGAATVDHGQVNARFTSPNGTFGSAVDYPILTVALRLSTAVVPGQTFTVMLNPNASFWQDLLGSPIAVELKPGTITVGGSVNITDVLPGGGLVPAGGQIRILGLGFSPQTKVSMRGNAQASSIQYVSPTEIRATIKDGAQLDGTLIQVQNPDNSSDSYYSYMRGVPQGQSTRSLIAKTVPVFSLLTATEAVLPPTVSPVNAEYATAIALQNPSAATASVTVEGRDGAGAVLASITISLPQGTCISREVSELLGVSLPVGGYLHIASNQPVQAVGMLANDSTGIVAPIAVTILAGPPAPVAPPTTPSGGGSGSGSGSGGGGGGTSGGGKTP